jgi:glycerol-3-phosphate acyltransferase PlsY
MGSGNIGATNVTRAFGWYAGVLVFVIDFMKGFLPLFILEKYFPEQPWLLTLTAATLVLGHCFSLFLKFRGGKGVATSFGCIALVAPWCALSVGLTYVVLLVATKISAVGSLGAILGALIYVAVIKPPAPTFYLILGIAVVVIVRHKDNISRLIETIKKRKEANK